MNISNKNIANLLDETLLEFKKQPVDMLNINDGDGEYIYLKTMRASYIRTIKDIVNFFSSYNKTDTKILEIGSFLGALTFTLKKLNFDICALDIPEFYKSKNVNDRFSRNNVPYFGVNLKEYQLPFESSSFDMVVMCEVLEHLNFNPLPVLKELNRVIKKDGSIYIGMPNQSRISMRVKSLFGISNRDSVDSFFQQLDKNENFIVGMHWREYTLSEACELLEKMGFEIIDKYYYADLSKLTIFNFIKYIPYLISSFKPFYVVQAKKINECNHEFTLSESI
jgi:SAM-dependent methyltransferase